VARQFNQELREEQQGPEGKPGSGAPAASSAGAGKAPEAPAGKPAAARAGKSTRTLEQRSALADRALARVATGAEPEAAKATEEPEATKPGVKPAEKPEAKGGAVELSPETKAAIAGMLTGGKLAELAALAGVDGKVMDASTAKLALVRERVTEATKRDQAADAKLAKVESQKAEARREFGAPFKAKAAYDRGDFAESAEWIAFVLKDDFATITRNVAKHTKGMDPVELARFQKERELKDREAALAAKEKKVETETTEAQRTGKALKTIGAKCSGHAALKLKGGSKLVLAVLQADFEEHSGTMTLGYRQAADRVLADFEEQATALGWSKPGAAPKEETKPAAKVETETPKGKRPFVASEGEHVSESGAKRRGKSMEERQAIADRAFQRGRLV